MAMTRTGPNDALVRYFTFFVFLYKPTNYLGTIYIWKARRWLDSVREDGDNQNGPKQRQMRCLGH